MTVKLNLPQLRALIREAFNKDLKEARPRGGPKKSASDFTPIPTKQAQQMFPQAFATIEDVGSLLFWLDARGRLHVDDAVHSAFDDVWNPKTREWDGSEDETPEARYQLKFSDIRRLNPKLH